MPTLTVHDHSRDIAGFTYVYPVISRRAGGVSVGINLNPNNACNWACIYCQVPDLKRGNAPAIDLARLETELRAFLAEIVHNDWLQRNAPDDARVLQDIAFSGNGEPTSAKEFPHAVEMVGRLLEELDLAGKLKVRLITNGSLMHRKTVLDAVASMATLNGEVWFKIDRATPAGMALVNGVSGNRAAVIRRLRACAARCPTWIQTCWFGMDGSLPAQSEVAAYLALMSEMRDQIKGVHLYGLARQPMQPGAERLSVVSEADLNTLAGAIRDIGTEAIVSP